MHSEEKCKLENASESEYPLYINDVSQNIGKVQNKLWLGIVFEHIIGYETWIVNESWKLSTIKSLSMWIVEQEKKTQWKNPVSFMVFFLVVNVHQRHRHTLIIAGNCLSTTPSMIMYCKRRCFFLWNYAIMVKWHYAKVVHFIIPSAIKKKQS